MTQIRAAEHNKGVSLNPAEYLGDKFSAYLAACKAAGARFDSATKSQVVAWGKLGDATAKLVEAGFTVVADDTVKAKAKTEHATAVEAHEAKQAAASNDIASLNARIAALAERGLNLFPFQAVGVPWLAPRRRALLDDDMGLGKTIQALVALPDNAPVVVVAPAAVKGVWKMECEMWRPDLTPVVLKGRKSFRWPEPGEMIVTNYDILPPFTGGPVEKGKRWSTKGREAVADNAPATGTVIVADECHALKNSKAQRTRKFAVMRDRVLEADGRVWLLTGTPLLNRPIELWQVLEAAKLGDDAFGRFPRFCWAFNGHRGRFGYEWGDPRPEVPAMLAKVSLRRLKREAMPDLPTKRYRDLPVNGLTVKVKRELDRLMAELDEKGIHLEDALRALEDGMDADLPFEGLSEIRALLATAKIPAMLEQIEMFEDSEEPLVVFSAHRAPIDLLDDREGWATITGDTKPERRTEIVAEFQAGRLKGVGLTIAAGGVGLTLTHASQMLFVDKAWTPALNEQAEDRCCRIGQERGVVITTLVAEHLLDVRINELLTLKQKLITASVDAAAGVAPTAPVEANAPSAPVLADPEPVVVKNSKFLAPRSAAEEWAGAGLVRLAQLDPDHATEKNGVGFNGADGDFGHSLAAAFDKYGGLTVNQWAAALKMLPKYHGQIGPCPEEE